MWPSEDLNHQVAELTHLRRTFETEELILPTLRGISEAVFDPSLASFPGFPLQSERIVSLPVDVPSKLRRPFPAIRV